MVDVVEEGTPIGVAADDKEVGRAILEAAAIHVIAAGGVIFTLIERVVIIIQRIILVTHPLVVLLVVNRHGAKECDVLDSTFVAARYAAYAGITISVLHVARHETILDSTTALVQANNTAQIGIFTTMIMVAFDVAVHKAVLYRAIVVASDAAHHSRTADFDIDLRV